MLDDAAARLVDRFENSQLVRGELHFTVGSTYAQLGAFDDALRHLRLAVADLEATAGPRAVSTLNAIAALGLTLSHLDQLDEAETVLRDALQRVSPSIGPLADGIREDLAIVLDIRGQVAEARQLFEDVYRRARKQLGANHADTLRAQNNLGIMLMDQRRLDEALPHLTECLAQRRDTLGENHPESIGSMANLGAVYTKLGRQEEAAVLLREAIERSDQVLGPAHLLTIRRRQNLIRLELGQGRFDVALATAQSLLDVCDREFGPTHRVTLGALELAVTTVALGGDMKGGETLALSWYERIKTAHGAEHGASGRVAYLLQNLYEEMGDSAKEDMWRQRVAATSFRPRKAAGN
jgi:tetratricopeptide (TPR) repeat protein